MATNVPEQAKSASDASDGDAAKRERKDVEDGRVIHTDFFRTIITVKVGPDAVPIQVHKELLCYHAGFFQGAFENERFEEAKRGVVVLDEEDERIFRMFVAWLYTGDITPPATVRPAEQGTPESLSVRRARTSLRLWAEQADLLAVHEVDDYERAWPQGILDRVRGPFTGLEEDMIASGALSPAPTGSQSSDDDDEEPADISRFCRQPSYGKQGPSQPLPLYVEQCEYDELDLIDLYILADRRNCTTLRNAVISLMTLEQNRSQLLFSPLGIHTAFSNLPPTAKLLEFIVQSHHGYTEPSTNGSEATAESYAKLPSDFLARLLWCKYTQDGGSGPSPHTVYTECYCHEHAIGLPGRRRQCVEYVNHRLWHPLQRRRADFYGVKLEPMVAHPGSYEEAVKNQKKKSKRRRVQHSDGEEARP